MQFNEMEAISLISNERYIELNCLRMGDEWDTEVTGVNGRFDFSELQSLISRLRSLIPEEVRNVLKVEKEDCVTFVLEVVEVPPETQYGTGFGDILRLPGYYLTKKIVEKSTYDCRAQIRIEESEE